jgi:hypothetical protein
MRVVSLCELIRDEGKGVPLQVFFLNADVDADADLYRDDNVVEQVLLHWGLHRDERVVAWAE